MKKMNKKGFTIVELVIVIAVIAVLAAVMIPTFGGMIDRANESNALSAAKNAHTTLLYSVNDPDDFDGYIVVKGEYFFEIEDGKLVETDGKIAAQDAAPAIDAETQQYVEVLANNADLSEDVDVFQLQPKADT